MNKEIKAILEEAKQNEGKDFYGVNFYRGKFYVTSIGAVKKISQKEAAEVIQKNMR